MSDHVKSLLDHRESELIARIDELRAQLAPAEAELEDVRAAKAVVAAQAARRIAKLPATGGEASASSRSYYDGVYGERAPTSQFRNLTMKELVRKALLEQFDDGATARQLLDLFHHEYGRVDIIRSSLSPQLSRLKVEGVIWRDGLVWRLSDPARTRDLLGAMTPDENGEAPANPEGGNEGGCNPLEPEFSTPSQSARKVGASVAALIRT